MEIEKQVAIEIKAEIEILSGLAKKINTGGTHENNTEYIHGESMESSRYIVEIDRFEHPFKYYHCQLLKYHCEIRRGKVNFEIHCFNFEPDIKKEFYIKKTNRNYGGNTHYIYETEDLQTAQYCYEEIAMALILIVKGIRENRLIY